MDTLPSDPAALPLPSGAYRVGLWLGLLVAGCGADDGPVPAAAASCATLSGMERDRCVHDEIGAVPGAQPDVVVEKAGQIKDPMIRGAAVSGWVAAHANELPQEKGQQLCNLLEGRDRSYCQRRLSSPHLQR